MKKHILKIFVGLMILGLLLAACQPGTGEVDAPQPEEAPAASSSTSTDVLFDPTMGGNTEATGLVYENLLNVQDGQLISALALEVNVSDDDLDYIISLRPAVYFHDDNPLNADAVIANFARWSDSAYDGVEKVDELTVLVHLNGPDADFPNKLADPAFAIVSPEALAAPNFGSAVGVDGGTGPYMIGVWSEMTITLEPYSGYWDSSAVPDSNMDITVGN